MNQSIVSPAAVLAAFDISTAAGRAVASDALEDAGLTDAANTLRSAPSGWSELAYCQTTEEGTEVITVGRDGADHDRHGNGIYTTKLYRAERRKKDGVLTWRLAGSWRGHRTAGKRETAPMQARAQAVADERGVVLKLGITHGLPCK